MFVSVTSVTGDGDVAETARMAGESMLGWLRDFDGYRGLLIFADAELGEVRVMSFWDTLEDANRSERGRTQVRDRMLVTTNAELESVNLYEVVLEDRVE
jgi:hypothetical protein